jgi:hypothetical protein
MPKDVKQSVNQSFSLTLEQLSFLYLLSEKFNLIDNELKLVEYLVTKECKTISINRFRVLDFESVSLAALLYLFDLKDKDYICILDFIDLVHPDKYKAGYTRSQTYKIYRNFYNTYFGVQIKPETYETYDNALKLKT